VDTSVEGPVRFHVTPNLSAVVVKARSNVGPITFGTTHVSGEIVCRVQGDRLAEIERASAYLELPVASLSSGNDLYDAEIHRRMDVRRYPVIRVELTSATQIADADRLLLSGKITLRDELQELHGAVSVGYLDLNTIVVEGEQALDIRDFRIEVPSTLLLKIYPEVLIEMHIEARAET
jgi:polyisoprenoid-binding protein YceI